MVFFLILGFYFVRISTGDLCVDGGDAVNGAYGVGSDTDCVYGKKPVAAWAVNRGDFDASSFFKLKFSGVFASSGAESTSKSDSGELGLPVVCAGDAYNRIFGGRGLLANDSEPVSSSVLCLFDPVLLFEEIKEETNKKTNWN